MSRSRRRPRPQVRTKALPGAHGNVSSRPQTYALADAINAATGQQLVNGSYNPMLRDPLNVSPFGPLNPLVPAPLDPARSDTGRNEPRVMEYPVSWNIPGNDNRPVPWQVLRGAAQYIDIVRRCVEVRKRHIRSLKWVWTVSAQTIQDAYQENPHRGKDDLESQLRQKFWPEINRLNDFWAKPWRSNGLQFGQWINGILEEHLVLDAVVIYPRMTLGGDCIDLEIVDGSTIKPLLDWRGSRPLPPYPAFQQILYGFPRGEFRATTEVDELGNTLVPGAYAADQLYYHRENFRPGSPGYGYSAVEQALISARLYLKRQGWMLAEYDDGSTPLTWLVPDAAAGAGEDWNPRQRRAWEDSLNDELAGQTAARHRIKVTPPGFKPDMMASVDERYKPDYDLHLLKLLATHFNVTLPELGFTEAKGLGSQGYHEGQEDVQDRIGRRPDLAIIGELITDLSRLFLHAPPELEFTFLGLESEDEAAQDAVAANQLQRGSRTWNDDRRRLGLPLYSFAEADMPCVITQRGLVFPEGASQLALPGQTIVPVLVPDTSGMPSGGSTDDPPASSTSGPAGSNARTLDKPQTGITKAKKPSDDERTQRTLVDRIITQLEPDYPDYALDWIRDIPWEGPTAVPLDQIDYSGADSWQASHEPEKVAKFKDAIRQNKIKPIIAVRKPGTGPLQVVDGHHRALAYQGLDQPAVAWIGTVNERTGPWDEMHSAQYEEPADGSLPASEASTANTKPKADEAAAYKRWAKRNPNPSRPFAFQHHTEAEIAELVKASPPDPKEGAPPPTGPPDTRWPGWVMDLAVAAFWAGELIQALTGSLPIDRLIQLWRARPGRSTLADQSAPLVDALDQVLGGIWTDGFLVGDRSADAVLSGGLGATVDWGAWKPGDTAAARQILSADGQDVGLARLLADGHTTINSIAEGRLDEVAAVLADGLEHGRTPAEIAIALRGVVDDPKWAEMVALTETSRAMSAAAHARYAANEVPATRWLTAHDQKVCPLCRANESAGAVPLGQPFPSGDLYPPGHPRCRCAPVPVLTRSAT